MWPQLNNTNLIEQRKWLNLLGIAGKELSVLSIEDRYLRELIILGKERGFLLYDEINDSLPEGAYSSDELNRIFSLFGSAGIEVVDSEQDFQEEGIRDNKRDEHGIFKKPGILQRRRVETIKSIIWILL